MKFDAAQIDAFFRASHDANPLHRDVAYALRSQFGRPVVYGMAAVLYAIGQWSAGKPVRLRSVRADFKKPLFVGESYDFTVTEARNGLRCRFGKGPVDYALISFEPATNPPSVTDPTPGIGFVPARDAAIEPRTGKSDVHFRAGDCEGLSTAFGIGTTSLPGSQLAALLWASYHVGMEMPGRQALFSELRIEFNTDVSNDPSAQIRLADASYDDRFNRYTVTGVGSGIEKLSIAAFKRPEPVDFPLTGMRNFADPPPFRDKTVFVSGAARGFGAVFARTSTLAGARIAINCRADARAAHELRDELRAAGHEADVFPADLEDPDSMSGLRAALASAYGTVDVIVNNAAPAIREMQFAEQTDAEFLGFVRQNLAITLHTSRSLLPLLPSNGQIIHISTRYLAKPARGFSHYLAAKAAQEGFIRALAEEHRGIDFLIARLPRILTDQTNLPFSFEPPADPRDVARNLIQAAVQRDAANFRQIDL